MIELILALALGILAGVVTGLFPGIHINLVAAGLLAGVGYFTGVPVLALVVFIVAMAITHTFLDFIPGVYLGAPEEDSFLAVLPGHQMLRQGKGHSAVVYTLYGSLIGLIVILIFSGIFVLFLEDVYEYIRAGIPYLLMFISFYLIFREDDWVNAAVVFLMAGFLGLFALNLPVREPLLPLLSGLFGVSALVVSLQARIAIPKQEVKSLKEIEISGRDMFKGGVISALCAPLCSFLPGIGSGHAAVLGSEVSGKFGEEKRNFLFLVGAINTIVMALSFVTIYAIGRTRSGAAVAVSEILGEFGLFELGIVLGVVFISGLVAFFLGIFLSGIFARGVGKFSYSKISIGVILLLVVVNVSLSNLLGLVVLVTASALGVFCITSRVRRIQLMGVLLLPTIVFYLGL
jgi:putative membrane protein